MATNLDLQRMYMVVPELTVYVDQRSGNDIVVVSSHLEPSLYLSEYAIVHSYSQFNSLKKILSDLALQTSFWIHGWVVEVDVT